MPVKLWKALTDAEIKDLVSRGFSWRLEDGQRVVLTAPSGAVGVGRTLAQALDALAAGK